MIKLLRHGADCEVLLPHARECIGHETEDEADVINQTQVALGLGWYLLLRGEYKMAEKVGRISVEAREGVLGRSTQTRSPASASLGWC